VSQTIRADAFNDDIATIERPENAKTNSFVRVFMGLSSLQGMEVNALIRAKVPAASLSASPTELFALTMSVFDLNGHDGSSCGPGRTSNDCARDRPCRDSAFLMAGTIGRRVVLTVWCACLPHSSKRAIRPRAIEASLPARGFLFVEATRSRTFSPRLKDGNCVSILLGPRSEEAVRLPRLSQQRFMPFQRLHSRAESECMAQEDIACARIARA
jgi:hypothetical protein